MTRHLPIIPLCAVVAGLLAGVPAWSSAPEDQGREIRSMPAIESHRERVDTVNRILSHRLETLLPRLMRETGFDMWVVINREYAEDPVYLTLVPEPVFSARRTTMLIFFDRGPELGIERLTISRYPLKDLYDAAWEGGSLEEQWTRLAEVITERNPRRIGINTSLDWPFADGLTSSLHHRLVEALGAELSDRLASAEELCVRWLETRTQPEIEVYPQVVSIARRVIAEAFSSDVITPGVTTTDDVLWYIRTRSEALGLRPWFQPYVNYQRPDPSQDPEAPFFGKSEGIIRRGDVLHTDVGICYLRLCTDTQEMGYVLRLGEQEVPEGLRRALAIGNRWQDLLTREFITGRTGNEILVAAQAAVDREEIVASIYTHPIGLFGHAPGPAIGMWDNQSVTAVDGAWKLHPDTAYAIEGNIKAPVPEWDDQPVQIKLEQSALFDGKRVLYLAGRQTRWHVIR